MANSGVAKLACLLITLMVAAVPHAQAAITCSAVLSGLGPCLGYLKTGGAPPPACCAGLKSLNSAASTTPDRQAACSCIKNLVTNVGANPVFVNSLAGKCSVNIPYQYSPSLDCSKVH
ncbi:hypothetical protein ACS0TY_015327 [Phlomoides rotata]